MKKLLEAIRNFGSGRASGDGWSQLLFASIALGLFAVGYHGYQPGAAKPYEFIVGGLLLSAASLLIGVLLGFLFGIPRYLQSDVAPSGTKVADPSLASAQQRVRYAANTNLEQISDWLTKILVGVGLTQLATLPETLGRMGNYFGSAIGPAPGAPQVAIVTILFFAICGFLFGYLWTRIFLGSELTKADAGAFEAQISSLAKQPEIDAKAMTLVTQYLTQNDASNVSLEELKAAIKGASAPVKVQVFYQAKETRSKNWESNKPLMERTIPIFEALIESDTENRFHQNHGQLGYALKDKRKADYASAEKALTEAIEIRGPASTNGWRIYELNRAICRIWGDSNFEHEQATPPALRDAILADLKVANQGGAVFDTPDPVLKKWRDLNAA